MKSKFGIYFILIILLCFSCKNHRLVHDIKSLSGSTIKIPNNLCAKIEGRDTSLLVNQSEFATMIIWYDTIQCASCSMNSVNIWKTFFEYSFDSIEGFNPIIIFSPNKRLLRDFEVSLKVTKFKYPVLVDYDNIFQRINPQIPMTSNLFHVFLLDKNKKVVLVGNPLDNKLLLQLYKKTIHELVDNEGVLVDDK